MESQLTFGIDLGGTSIRVGLYDKEMQSMGSRSMTTRVSDGPQSCVDEMAQAVKVILQKNDVSTDRVVGIGIGSPGPINLKTGVLGLLPNLPGWENFPLRDALSEATGLPVILESDANAAAIAEWRVGSGRSTGLESMVMLTLGTGVGSGIILNGRVWHGIFGMAGELGHASIDPDGLLCACGTRGCLEMYTSANGLIRLAHSVANSADGTPALHHILEDAKSSSAMHIAKLAEEGDKAARLTLEKFGFYLGIGIANLINSLDPPMIIVGGGVADAWPLFAPAMFRSVREYSVVYRLMAPQQQQAIETNRTFICKASLGSSAGLLGAAILPQFASSMSNRC